MYFLAVDDEHLQLNKLVDCIRAVAPKDNLSFFDNPLLAYEAAKKSKFDVAFLDIEMAGMNGVELAKKLKGINPGINIIFVTGYAEYALLTLRYLLLSVPRFPFFLRNTSHCYLPCSLCLFLCYDARNAKLRA